MFSFYCARRLQMSFILYYMKNEREIVLYNFLHLEKYI